MTFAEITFPNATLTYPVSEVLLTTYSFEYNQRDECTFKVYFDLAIRKYIVSYFGNKTIHNTFDECEMYIIDKIRSLIERLDKEQKEIESFWGDV